MQKIKDFCNLQQQAILKQINELIRGFYESTDNSVTYALTGLISELTKRDYNDPHYLTEKLGIIIAELRRA